MSEKYFVSWIFFEERVELLAPEKLLLYLLFACMEHSAEGTHPPNIFSTIAAVEIIDIIALPQYLTAIINYTIHRSFRTELRIRK